MGTSDGVFVTLYGDKRATMGRLRQPLRGDNFTIMITHTQCKMARAAAGLSVRELADAAGVGLNTVSRFENGKDTLSSTVQKLQAALEAAGVEFIPENGGGAGVRLRKPTESR